MSIQKVVAARLFKDLLKLDKFEIKGAAFEGKIQMLSSLATLPTYEEAIARLMGTMKEAAAGKLVALLRHTATNYKKRLN